MDMNGNCDQYFDYKMEWSRKRDLSFYSGVHVALCQRIVCLLSFTGCLDKEYTWAKWKSDWSQTNGFSGTAWRDKREIKRKSEAGCERRIQRQWLQQVKLFRLKNRCTKICNTSFPLDWKTLEKSHYTWKTWRNPRNLWFLIKFPEKCELDTRRHPTVHKQVWWGFHIWTFKCASFCRILSIGRCLEARVRVCQILN